VRSPSTSPRLHLFVCANRREGSPLGPGCGAYGDAVYDVLKQAVAEQSRIQDVWVTKTHCLGICPKRGATVARYPGDRPIVTEVEAAEAASLLAERGEDTLRAFARELDALERLQDDKVLALATRLKQGVTAEDIRNPHDFPELADPDWQYADGERAGIAAAKAALARLVRERG
jgi:hypothetical protein